MSATRDAPVVALQDGAPGCPEIIWDGPYRMRCSLGTVRCSRHGRFETAPRPSAADLRGDRTRAQWVAILWRDWPQAKRDAVAALSHHLAAAIEDLAVAELPIAAGPASADRVETAARVLHSRRHRAGYSHCCDACRGDARAVAAALTATEENAR